MIVSSSLTDPIIMTSRPHLLLALTSLLCGVMKAAPAAPNFVIIYADDLGYGDVSMHGSSEVSTPHMDRIAEEGMQFTAMRANCTVCSPSRAALLTGRFADRVGVPGVIRTNPADSWGFLAPGVPTLAGELAKSARWASPVRRARSMLVASSSTATA